MKRILFCLMLLFVLSPLSANASEKDEILQQSQKLFGEPLDKIRNLFEVNDFYVFRIDFDKKDRVAELAIEPKYYFENFQPEWEETDKFKPLTFTEYKNLLEKLENIKTKGKILEKATIGIVGNATAFYKNKYDRALLETGYVFSLDADEKPPTEIRYFKIDFRKNRNKVQFVKPLKFPK